MMSSRLVAVAFVVAACHPPPRARPDLGTEAERSGWKRTGRYDEAVRLCHAFAAAYPAQVSCETFGTTKERRPMVALHVRARSDAPRPTILVQGGIHAGEIEGKDAGFWLIRDLLEGKVAPGALDAVDLVFVPVLNPDGHERFGVNHRPNQRGPEEMGFRTNAQNLNLNRDYVKVDTPEIAALLGLWARVDPVVYVDLHATDGAKFEHDLAVMVAPAGAREGRLDELAGALSDGLQARLGELGHLPLDFYPSFEVHDDPASGFATGEAPPRFSQAYAAARDRIGILVETHSWRTYAERAESTYHTLQALLERATRDAASWQDAARAADALDLSGREVTLLHQATDEVRTIEFRGYAYQRRPSEVSGGTWTVYDETRPEVWNVPMRDVLAPALTVTAPRAGYLVQAGFADEVAARLDAHGIEYRRLDAARAVDGQVFRAAEVSFAPRSFEGRTLATIEGAWAPERREVGAGAIYVPIAQPGARLILEMFEPTAADSLAAWGFFNAVFEAKEYIEGYLLEEFARAELEDPAVRAAFDEALKDEAFAKDPRKRLEFFAKRHPARDERKDLLPVLKLDVVP